MVVVCGEALIDVIQNADGSQRTVPGGGPFNTARALARLGVPAAFLGRLSEDRFGRELHELLALDGVSLDLTSVGPEPTTTAVARVDSHGSAEYQFQVEGTSAPNLTLEMLPARLGHDVNALHLGTLGLSLEPMASTLVELVRREGQGRMVMLDPNVRAGAQRGHLAAVIGASTIVKASDTDVAWLFPDRDYRGAAEDLIRQGIRMVVVTLGAHGAYGAHGDHRLHVDAPPVEVVDTIGAGDAFGAGLLAWLHDHDLAHPDFELDEKGLRAALAYACLAASLTCARAGADPPSKREMAEAGRTFGIATE